MGVSCTGRGGGRRIEELGKSGGRQCWGGIGAVRGFRADIGGGEASGGGIRCGSRDAAAVADRGGIVEGWAEKIEAPELAGEEEAFRGDGADGRVDTRLVRRTERGLLPDEYGGRCDGDKAVPVRGRRNDRRGNEVALGMDREIRYTEGAVQDKKNVYVPDERVRREAREEGREALTKFGRACHQLGIRIIAANSPQAKGRVERSHRVYQDRLVKEMRLLGTGTIEDANHLLESGFTDDLNGRFAVEAAEAVDYHRPAEGVDLAAVFGIEEERSVTPDWMVRFENRFFQLVRSKGELPGERSRFNGGSTQACIFSSGSDILNTPNCRNGLNC